MSVLGEGVAREVRFAEQDYTRDAAFTSELMPHWRGHGTKRQIPDDMIEQGGEYLGRPES